MKEIKNPKAQQISQESAEIEDRRNRQDKRSRRIES